jgi:hypothetical protein
VTGRIRRTTPAQALAGIVTAELIAATEARIHAAHLAEVPSVLEALAAKPCARPDCGHPLENHGYHGGMSAFRWSSCSNVVIVDATLAACGCQKFLHAE